MPDIFRSVPSCPPPRRRAAAAALSAAALAMALTACGGAARPASSGASAGRPAPPVAMPGMGAMATGDGLSARWNDYALTSGTSALPAGVTADYRFTVTGPGGRPVTDFAVDQTKRLHFYAIRSDLTGFQHVHPTMAADGTWTARLAALRPGNWRLFAQFVPATGEARGRDLVLSRTVTVPGSGGGSGGAADAALPAPASSATVDGYTVSLTGDLMAGMAHPLTVTISRGGRPVTDLRPYLGAYGHLTAFHQGDEAFAHLHPETETATATETKTGEGAGGPTLTFHAELPKSGDWRLFLQFRTDSGLHTAALTLHVD